MKKFYTVLAVFAAVSLSASAQVEKQQVEEASDASLLNEQTYLPSQVIRKAAGDPKAPIGYRHPKGSLWPGLSENYYAYGTTQHLIVPPFAELEFTALHGDTVTHEWSYVNPEGEYLFTNPQLKSTEKTIKLTYTWPKQTQIEAPMLTGTGDNLSDSVFMQNSSTYSIYMQVGRRGLVGSTAAGAYTFGNHPRGKVFWSNASYINSSLYTPNSSTFASAWLTQYQNWYGSNMSAVTVKGLGERFDKPLSPLTITQIWIAGQTPNADDTFGSDMKMTVRDADGKVLAYAILPKDEITHRSATTKVCWLCFKNLYDADGNAIQEIVVDEEFYVFYEPQDDTTQFQFVYFRAPYFGDDDIFISTLCDYTYNGYDYTDQILSGGGVYANGTCQKTFTIYLQCTNEWMHGDVTEYVAPSTGGTTTVNVNASVEYLSYMERNPNWEVTLEDGSPLPSWITVSATDSFDEEYNYQRSTEVKLTVAALTDQSVTREANVKLSYHGASHIVKVTQAGTSTGINELTTDTDDNAPAYNLAGQRVNESATGVVIKNGKKMIKK